MVRTIVAATLLLGASLSPAEEPVIDHQPVECSIPQKNTRICAYVLDDGVVKRVRAYFRAQKQQAFYWTDMTFDGIQYCATLPVAKKKVRNLEYSSSSRRGRFNTRGSTSVARATPTTTSWTSSPHRRESTRA